MIVGVAILKDGIIYALPRPARHCHLFAEVNDSQRESAAKLIAEGKEVPPGWLTTFAGWPAASIRDGEQGFVDECGKFLDREEAYCHAVNCKQLPGPTKGYAGELFSEDVW